MRRKMLEKCGLAMYTVHRNAQKDLYRTLCGAAELGYRGIEFYGEQTYDLRLLETSLKDSGLVLTGWHVEWRDLQDDRFPQTVGYLQAAGCPVAVIPCLGGRWNVGHGPKEECREIWLRYIEEINRIARKLKTEGIRAGYHNHEHEFALSYDGKTVFDLLFEGLSGDVMMELDTGNCIEGGGDPVRVLKRYRDRDVLLHLKPWSYERGFDVVLGDGDDANDWGGILDPDAQNCRWLLVESENASLPEMENAGLCMRGLKQYFNG